MADEDVKTQPKQARGHNIVPCQPPFDELGECTVCGAAEGELLSFCPGFLLNAEAREACFQGNVVDLHGFLRWRAAGVVR